MLKRKLKSTLGKFGKSRLNKNGKPIGQLLKGGMTAVIGLSFLSQTASVIRKI